MGIQLMVFRLIFWDFCSRLIKIRTNVLSDLSGAEDIAIFFFFLLVSIYFLQEKKGISRVRLSTDSLYVDWDISPGTGIAEQYHRAFLNQNNRAHDEVRLFYYLFKNNFIKKRFLCDSLSTVLLVSLKLISIQQNWAWLHSKQMLNAGWIRGSNCFSERAMQSWCGYCEARIFREVCHLKLAQSTSCAISLTSARWARKISCIVADKD